MSHGCRSFRRTVPRSGDFRSQPQRPRLSRPPLPSRRRRSLLARCTHDARVALLCGTQPTQERVPCATDHTFQRPSLHQSHHRTIEPHPPHFPSTPSLTLPAHHLYMHRSPSPHPPPPPYPYSLQNHTHSHRPGPMRDIFTSRRCPWRSFPRRTASSTRIPQGCPHPVRSGRFVRRRALLSGSRVIRAVGGYPDRGARPRARSSSTSSRTSSGTRPPAVQSAQRMPTKLPMPV